MWRKDGRAFTFEYNQRGHQVYRVIEVDAATRRARGALITEESKTFIDYRPLVSNPRDTGKKFRFDVNDGKRNDLGVGARRLGAPVSLGWRDAATQEPDHQRRLGGALRRRSVDESKRQIWFEASGMNPGEDPYFTHEYRINFDGTGLTPLTEADANHTVTFSTDMKYFVDA